MGQFLLIHLMLGPLILVIGYLFRRFPPKRINHWYGYRTPRSMRSQQAWDVANRYSANAVMVAGAFTCLVQVVTYSLMAPKSTILWSANAMVVALIAIIPATEIYLKKLGFR